jgi:antitoxin component of RelBE/YafQ-DinJ toxin-antitoxin module
MAQENTESVRIDKETLERIKVIAKAKGQTISGYININLQRPVERHWHQTIAEIEKRKKNNI